MTVARPIDSTRWLVCVQAVATLFMTGLIWFVQVVHYPLFEEVARSGGATQFAAYEARHTTLTSWVVGPPMLVEAACTGLLLLKRPRHVATWMVWAGAGLLAAIWLSTGFLQVPRHAELAGGFDSATHRMLVNSNWIRTVCWSLRALLCSRMLFAGMPAKG